MGVRMMIITNPDWLQFVINILCVILFSAIGYKIKVLTVEIKNLKNTIDCLHNYNEHLPRQK